MERRCGETFSDFVVTTAPHIAARQVSFQSIELRTSVIARGVAQIIVSAGAPGYRTFDQFMLRHDNDKQAAERGFKAFAQGRISHTLHRSLSQNKTHFARNALRETKLADVSR